MDCGFERRKSMIKNNLKVLIITSVIILLPIAAGLILWDQLPQRLPIHWNAAGEVDGWCGKGFFVLGLSPILLGLQWLCVFATVTDPKKTEHTKKILHLSFWIIPVLSILLHIITYLSVFGNEVRVEIIMPIILGVLFATIGNYLPKCKQNFTIGIKCPWTLSSQENWNKTHRFAGWLWMIGGLAIAVLGIIGGAWVCLILLLLMALGPFVYSYLLHKKGI